MNLILIVNIDAGYFFSRKLSSMVGVAIRLISTASIDLAFTLTAGILGLPGESSHVFWRIVQPLASTEAAR